MLNINQIQHYAMSRNGAYLALCITAIFSFLILLNLYQGIVFLVKKPTVEINQLALQNTPQQIQRVNLSALHLFGLYHPANLNPTQLPKSTLNIQLNGVFVAIPEKLSQAVLTVPGQLQKVYYQGDDLPGNAKLYRILTNSVIIQYDGELQSLMLLEPKIKLGTQPSSLNLPGSIKSNPSQITY